MRRVFLLIFIVGVLLGVSDFARARVVDKKILQKRKMEKARARASRAREKRKALMKNYKPPIAKSGKTVKFSDEAVEKAIKKAQAYLWARQNEDGSWPTRKGRGRKTGYTALAAYALLESGVSPKDPRMGKTLNYIASHPSNFTYTLGVICNVWLAAAKKDRRYMSLLRRDANILIRSNRKGAYGYYCKCKHRSAMPGRDNSATQYAILGVWAAARAGGEIPRQFWNLSARHWIGCQNGDGGWGYMPDSKHEIATKTRATMAAAGVASLFVCFDNTLSRSSSFRNCRIGRKVLLAQTSIKRGLKWFDLNFRKSMRNPSNAYYYLYGVERIGLASGYKYFGDADWYKLGSQYLLRRQLKNGSWRRGYTTESATAFALLFLIRGRNAVLFNKLQFKGDWNNRPRDMASLTRWISRSTESTVNWQIINLAVPVEEWHDTPILYISGSRKPEFDAEALKKLRKYVHQGGTIFSVTECDGRGFKTGIRKVYKKIFPQYKLTKCPPGHPLYSIRYKLGGKPTMYVVSNGARPLIIHVDADLSRYWQLQAVASGKWAYRAAVNVLMYVTDKAASLRRRGTSHWPEEVEFKPKATVKLAHLKYDGNYDPEPLAYKRFAVMMAKHDKIKVEVTDPIKITDLPQSEAKLAVLVGTEEFKLSKGEQSALKKFVSSGGTLFIDAAGGVRGGAKSKGFDKSVKKILGEMYPDTMIDTLAGTADLYNIAGMKIEKIRWRRGTKIKMGTGEKSREPKLQAIIIAKRPAVIYSPHDITTGLLGIPSGAVFGYSQGDNRNPGSAYDLMRNITVYSDNCLQ